MPEKNVQINTKRITQAVSELCRKANLYMTNDTYQALYDAYKNETSQRAKSILEQILKNSQMAANAERPLCQDTGMVTVFAEVGQNVHFTDGDFEKAINQGVADSYIKNYFRKSIVKKPLYIRNNTESNTPAVIHTKIVPGNRVKLSVAVKGGGSENMSALKMFSPSVSDDDIVNYVVDVVKNAGGKPCPPIRLGLGFGGNFELAAMLSKKAVLQPIEPMDKLRMKAQNDRVAALQCQIYDKVNELGIGAAGLGGDTTVFGINILTAPTHIASLPLAITINCHSSRHAEAEISENGINYHYDCFEYEPFNDFKGNKNARSLNVDDFDELKNLKAGDEVLLNGIIYTARDAAHRELLECIKKGIELPFDVKNKILFYVGPCPARDDEVIGPAGPTTSARMDKFSPLLYDLGLLATIGKGERSAEVIESIKTNKSIYFVATGGVATLLSKSIKKAKIVAFPGLGPEAVYQLEISDFPVIVAVDSEGNTV